MLVVSTYFAVVMYRISPRWSFVEPPESVLPSDVARIGSFSPIRQTKPFAWIGERLILVNRPANTVGNNAASTQIDVVVTLWPGWLLSLSGNAGFNWFYGSGGYGATHSGCDSHFGGFLR